MGWKDGRGEDGVDNARDSAREGRGAKRRRPRKNGEEDAEYIFGERVSPSLSRSRRDVLEGERPQPSPADRGNPSRDARINRFPSVLIRGRERKKAPVAEGSVGRVGRIGERCKGEARPLNTYHRRKRGRVRKTE